MLGFTRKSCISLVFCQYFCLAKVRPESSWHHNFIVSQDLHRTEEPLAWTATIITLKVYRSKEWTVNLAMLQDTETSLSKISLRILSQNGRFRGKGYIFDITYSHIAQITYGKSSYETYTHNHPSLWYMLWRKDKASSSGENDWDEKCWVLHVAAFPPANPKHNKLRVSLRSLSPYVLSSHPHSLQGRDNTCFKWTRDFKRSSRS